MWFSGLIYADEMTLAPTLAPTPSDGRCVDALGMEKREGDKTMSSDFAMRLGRCQRCPQATIPTPNPRSQHCSKSTPSLQLEPFKAKGMNLC